MASTNHKYVTESYIKEIYNIFNSCVVDEDLTEEQVYQEAMDYTGKRYKSSSSARAQRAMVNGLRHQHSNYDDNLNRINYLGRLSGEQEFLYRRYKNSCLTKIANQYSFLSDEWTRQKKCVEMCTIIK